VVAAVAPLACGGGGGKAKSDAGTQMGCQNSLQCALGQVCDPSIAQCVMCVTAADCPANNDCTARTCVPFTPCKNSLDCSSAQVCDATAGRCVDCLTDADCADTTKTCVADMCRTKCASDRTCTPLGLLCDLTSGSCVRCITATDCPSGQYCQANTCQAAVCTPGQTSCMLNGVATCNTVGDGYVGTAVACDPLVCQVGASGASCVAAATGGSGGGGATGGGGAGGNAGTTGAGGATGAGGTTGAGGSAGATGTGGVAGTTGAGGATGAGGSSGAGGVTGTGGTTGAGGTTGTGGAGGGACGLTIDNMEADTGIICQGNGRIGHWFAYNDGSSSTTQTPPPNVAPTRPDPIQPPRGASNYAMHTYGSFYTYGAIGCSLNGSTSNLVEVPNAYDVTAFTGITFFAKGTPGSLQVIVSTVETTASAYGGTCSAASCSGNRLDITLDPTTWTSYKVPFSSLASGNALFNPQHVLTIDFQVYAVGGVTADFWIDDLAFY